ncbi:MAG TPA: site-specific DNA-methyltransferase [Candidatus Pacearchaeota archaeon]|nr:site-specific DNA-methyltransferase [Candidatus Pacearchaeota archaeon]HOS12492.1 site-specific DNA-methyltransferase [Candidatus Pacearchaeota archaeon]
MLVKDDKLQPNGIFNGDSIELVKRIDSESIHLILSDIPYGIGVDDWDVLHSNTNTAYLGTSPAQVKAGAVFKKRGKPLNGWSKADRLIPKQYYDWVSTWAEEWYRILKPGASAIIFAGRRLAHRAICAFEDAGFTYKDMIAWEKERAPHRAQRISVIFERRDNLVASKKWVGWKVGNLRPTFEPILWFTKPYRIGGTIVDNVLQFGVGAYNETIMSNYNQKPDNIIKIQGQRFDSGLHPTQKPLALMELLIELTTIQGQVVLDPFCGSGTTLIAAIKLGRKYMGIEKEKEYYDTAQNRVKELEINSRNTLF